MATGTVKYSNQEKRYGFIAQDDGGQDVFVDFSAWSGGMFNTLEENMRVEFQITQGPKGPQAEQVKVIR